MDEALVQDDGIDLIVAELDRCWEVTQDQDKASKIEKALFETLRDAQGTFGLCIGATTAVSRHCHFWKRFRDGRSTQE